MVEETKGPVHAHEMPPAEVAQAAETVGRWFAERNIKNWKLCSCASRAQLEGSLDEIVEYDALHQTLSGILTRTANVLKGEPDKLTRHSWHDLPDVAKSLHQRFVDYEDETVAYLDRLGDLVGQGEDEKLEDAIARVLDERETFRDNAIKAEEALANEQARGIHTCNPGCTRDGCVNRRLREELAATQARLARIIELDRLMREPDWHIESIREMQKEKNALQDSADDTALRDRLRAERERVLLFLKQDGWYDAPAYVAAAVRALDDKP